MPCNCIIVSTKLIKWNNLITMTTVAEVTETYFILVALTYMKGFSVKQGKTS